MPGFDLRAPDDLEAQLAELRRGFAVYSNPELAVLQVSGRDAQALLHRVLAAKLQGVGPGEALPAALLTPKAHVIALMTVLVESPQAVLCVLPEVACAATLETLERYAITDDVVIERGAQRVLGVYGPALSGCPALEPFAELAPYRHRRALLLGEHEVVVLGDDQLATVGLACLVPSAAAGVLAEHFATCGGVQMSTAAYEVARIAAGTPKMGAEITSDTLVLEAGQLEAVSLNKGCYPGQEPVCRVQSRGQVNWRLLGLRIAGARTPAAGEGLSHPEKAEAGYVTSAAYSPELRAIVALGYVHRKAAEQGTSLTLAHGGTAEVVPLPHLPGATPPRTCPRYG